MVQATHTINNPISQSNTVIFTTRHRSNQVTHTAVTVHTHTRHVSHISHTQAQCQSVQAHRHIQFTSSFTFMPQHSVHNITQHTCITCIRSHISFTQGGTVLQGIRTPKDSAARHRAHTNMAGPTQFHTDGAGAMHHQGIINSTHSRHSQSFTFTHSHSGMQHMAVQCSPHCTHFIAHSQVTRTHSINTCCNSAHNAGHSHAMSGQRHNQKTHECFVTHSPSYSTQSRPGHMNALTCIRFSQGRPNTHTIRTFTAPSGSVTFQKLHSSQSCPHVNMAVCQQQPTAQFPQFFLSRRTTIPFPCRHNCRSVNTTVHIYTHTFTIALACTRHTHSFTTHKQGGLTGIHHISTFKPQINTSPHNALSHTCPHIRVTHIHHSHISVRVTACGTQHSHHHTTRLQGHIKRRHSNTQCPISCTHAHALHSGHQSIMQVKVGVSVTCTQEAFHTSVTQQVPHPAGSTVHLHKRHSQIMQASHSWHAQSFNSQPHTFIHMSCTAHHTHTQPVMQASGTMQSNHQCRCHTNKQCRSNTIAQSQAQTFTIHTLHNFIAATHIHATVQLSHSTWCPMAHTQSQSAAVQSSAHTTFTSGTQHVHDKGTVHQRAHRHTTFQLKFKLMQHSQHSHRQHSNTSCTSTGSRFKRLTHRSWQHSTQAQSHAIICCTHKASTAVQGTACFNIGQSRHHSMCISHIKPAHSSHKHSRHTHTVTLHCTPTFMGTTATFTHTLNTVSPNAPCTSQHSTRLSAKFKPHRQQSTSHTHTQCAHSHQVTRAFSISPSHKVIHSIVNTRIHKHPTTIPFKSFTIHTLPIPFTHTTVGVTQATVAAKKSHHMPHFASAGSHTNNIKSAHSGKFNQQTGRSSKGTQSHHSHNTCTPHSRHIHATPLCSTAQAHRGHTQFVTHRVGVLMAVQGNMQRHRPQQHNRAHTAPNNMQRTTHAGHSSRRCKHRHTHAGPQVVITHSNHNHHSNTCQKAHNTATATHSHTINQASRF